MMRISLAICWVALSAGCAHSPEKAREPATQPGTNSEALSRQASKSYEALDFPACVEQFRQAAEATQEQEARGESFYMASRCAALANQPSQAMELLKRAVQSGYFEPDMIQYCWDLSTLQAQPGWQEVLAGAKA